MKPREFFPNMPDEVFDNWLAPIINDHGWPFTSINDDLFSSDWIFKIGNKFSLKQWFECEWELTDIPLDNANFKHYTLKIISEIIVNAVNGIPTETTDLIGGDERFRACASFYREYGKIPWPIVIYKFSNFVRVLDGFHRLAAIFHVGYPHDFKVPAWEAKFK